MRWLFVVAVVAALPTRASADPEEDAEEDAEQPTAVDVSFTGTTARIKAKFAFEISAAGVAVGMHSFAIPHNSVVTSGVAIVDGKRHALRFDKADEADRAFDALTLKPSQHGNRAWVFLLDGAGDVVTLDVLAPRSANVVLELILDAPTCFFDDVRYVELDEAWWKRVPARQKTIIATSEQLDNTCSDRGDEHVRWIGSAARELSKQPPGQRRMGTIAGRLALASTHLARVEIDLAREISEVPADLHTAIVIDHSRSLTADDLDVERAIVAAYLRAAPTSRVQVIGFARRAQPLLASWMVASHAAPQVDRVIRALPLRNGSNVDDALVEAAKWLAQVRGTKRIIVFSDERLGERFDGSVELLQKLIASGTLVHVVHPIGLGSGLERNDDDESVLPLLAKATQGIATFGTLNEKAEVDATMLVRPISIDKLDVTAAGWERLDALPDGRDCETSLREGVSCMWWGAGNGAAGPITISGLMWNKPIKRVVHADPTQALALARVLSAMHALDDELQKQVDDAARAVNSVWSLFAQWGGSGGYEDLGGFGTIGGSRFSTSSRDHAIGTSSSVRGRAPLDLRAQLQPAVDGCGAREPQVTISVETTLEEIVDVAVEVKPANATIADCITEAVWDTTLGIIDPPARVTTRVAFGNKR
jgi:hypothetical protein